MAKRRRKNRKQPQITLPPLTVLRRRALDRRSWFWPRPAEEIVHGWRVLLSVRVPPWSKRVRWHLSARLFPFCRSSTEEDWHMLGQITHAVGMPEEAADNPVTPIATTDPSRPHHWSWTEDDG